MTENFTIAVAMPAFREAAALDLYARELRESFVGFKVTFHLVDDASPDNTGEVASRAGFMVTRNSTNMGHGPSYLNALSNALKAGADLILMTDGDGQLAGRDAANMVRFGLEGKTDLVWGVRTNRSEALYRKATSFLVRLVSFALFGVWARDANTPHRLFSRRAAEIYLERVPRASKVPNVLGTIEAKRANDLILSEFQVRFRDRLGEEKAGVTWGRPGLLPTRRFVVFVAKAFFEVLSFRVGRR